MIHTLVVGTGGREHALVRALTLSPSKSKIFAWPGSDGIFAMAERVPVAAGDFSGLSRWAAEKEIDLVIIGPEAEIVAGLSDELRAHNIPVFAPSSEAAQLEGSKIFAKKFMEEFSIPTARASVVDSVHKTMSAAKEYKPPYVLKADGLAAGKGVFICKDPEELRAAAVSLFDEKKFGTAGERALLEEFQRGEELSVLALTNGSSFEVLPLCRDHKRLKDGDQGPNTGGMGVVGPIAISKKLSQEILKQVVEPTIMGLKKRRFLYRGVVFIGIMMTSTGPMVLEYNVRFGDPETQVLLPLMDGDWSDVFLKISRGEMPKLKWSSSSAACVVLAAQGYPDAPVKNAPISGDLEGDTHCYVLHAGTKMQERGYVTNGGRVLNVVAVGSDLREALSRVYQKIEHIQWPGVQYRRDIGSSSLD